MVAILLALASWLLFLLAMLAWTIGLFGIIAQFAADGFNFSYFAGSIVMFALAVWLHVFSLEASMAAASRRRYRYSY